MHERLVLLGAVACLLGVSATQAHAQEAAPKLEATVRLAAGKPSHVEVLRDESGIALAVDGQRHPLPLRDAAKIETQNVALAKGHSAVIVTVLSQAGARAGAVLVRGRRGAEVVFVGPLDPRGDAGERTWSVVEAPAQPNGEAQLRVSQKQERTAVCGAEPASIAPQVLDPQTGKLSPAPVARPFGQREIIEVAASTTSPGPQAAPQLGALRVSAASSLRDAALPWLGSPIASLTDGDPRSAWTTAADRPAQHAFATLHVDAAGRALRAFSIVAKPVGSTALTPRVIWLVPEDGPVLHVTLAEPIGEGQAQWITLAQPRPMRCVSVVIDQVAGTEPGKPGSAAIAELAAYTDLDFGNGVERLIAELSAGGSPAARAVDVLRRMGPAVVAPLVAALPSLSPGARARAVRVWSVYLADPAARAALHTALDDPDARVRELAYEALAQGDEAARGVLIARIGSAGLGAEAAATALARTAPKEATAAVLVALGSDGASERAELREALAAACERLKGACLEVVRAWLGTAQPKVAARASVALALARHAEVTGAPELAAELIASAAPEARAFEDLWRLVGASVSSAPSPVVDAWLAELAAKDERWMLRATALSALGQRKAGAFAELAKKALKDEYPRVRLVAVQALASDASATAALATHAQRDRWPMVRAAAYDSLAKHPAAGATLQAGVEDRAKSVRAAALRALTTARVTSAWPAVEKVLRNDNEWPEVTIEAAAYARALCVQQAREPLVELLVRAINPNAAPFEAEVGGAVFEALAELGGEAAADAQRVAGRPTSPPGLKAMAKQAAARKADCAVSVAAPGPAM
jgi:hypothetical protein